MSKVCPVSKELNALFKPEWIRRTAREQGAVRRFVKVDILILFWTLILGPAVGVPYTLASLQRKFEAVAGFKLAPSSFLERFSSGLVRFLKACLTHAMNAAFQPWATPAIFKHFADVVVQDSTLLTLADSLARLFPGSRCASAAKVNAVYSVLRGNLRSLVIAAGTEGEPRFVRINRSLRGFLFLLDLGYFSWDIFAAIDRVRAFFVSRLKKNANPRIVRDFHHGPGRTRSLVGLKLRDALRGLGRAQLDVEVEVTVRNKVRGRKAGAKKTVSRKVRFRVVGVRHPDSGGLYLYITNVGPDVLTPDQVRVCYSARWFGELLWREMKTGCQMDELPGERDEVIRSLVLVAAIRLMVSRVVLEGIKSRAADEARQRFSAELSEFVIEWLVLRMGVERFQRVWRDLSVFFLLEVLRQAGIGWNPRHLERLLLASMLDPNKDRNSLLRRLMEA